MGRRQVRDRDAEERLDGGRDESGWERGGGWERVVSTSGGIPPEVLTTWQRGGPAHRADAGRRPRPVDVMGIALGVLNLAWAALAPGTGSRAFLFVLGACAVGFGVAAVAGRRAPWGVPLAIVAAGLAVSARGFADLVSGPASDASTSAFFVLAAGAALLLPVYAPGGGVPAVVARVAAPVLVGLFSLVPLLDASLPALLGLVLLLVAPLASLRPWGARAAAGAGAAIVAAMLGVQGPAVLARLAVTGEVGSGLLLALVFWGFARLALRQAAVPAALAAAALAASAMHAQIDPIWHVATVPMMLGALLGSATAPSRGN